MSDEWKGISCKQNARWQHLSRLKASAFFSLKKKKLVVKKHYSLYLGLVTPSSGWRSPIESVESSNILRWEIQNFMQIILPLSHFSKDFSWQRRKKNESRSWNGDEGGQFKIKLVPVKSLKNGSLNDNMNHRDLTISLDLGQSKGK